MGDENRLFRKTSMDNISAPEELNDYIRVVSPGVWITITAIIILLLGFMVWGHEGKMETVEPVDVTVKDNSALCYVSAEIAGQISENDILRIERTESPIVSVSSNDTLAREVFSPKKIMEKGLSGNSAVRAVTAETKLADGSYNGEIVLEHIRPMDFITN